MSASSIGSQTCDVSQPQDVIDRMPVICKTDFTYLHFKLDNRAAPLPSGDNLWRLIMSLAFDCAKDTCMDSDLKVKGSWWPLKGQCATETKKITFANGAVSETVYNYVSRLNSDSSIARQNNYWGGLISSVIMQPTDDFIRIKFRVVNPCFAELSLLLVPNVATNFFQFTRSIANRLPAPNQIICSPIPLQPQQQTARPAQPAQPVQPAPPARSPARAPLLNGNLSDAKAPVAGYLNVSIACGMVLLAGMVALVAVVLYNRVKTGALEDRGSYAVMA